MCQVPMCDTREVLLWLVFFQTLLCFYDQTIKCVQRSRLTLSRWWETDLHP